MHWRTLSREQLTQVEQRCRPGAAPDHVCSAGMLAPTESLREVLERDEQTLERLNITRFQIATVLDLAVESAKTDVGCIRSGAFQIEDRRYSVVLRSYMGYQESPFGGHLPNSQHCVTVTAESDNKQYSFGGGLAHMIRHNGFFEGNVPAGAAYKHTKIKTFRVDPEECVQFFGIQPETNYAAQLATAKIGEVPSPNP
jgi:hypothetical protein